MPTNYKLLFIFLICTITIAHSQDLTTIEAASADISDNLDLEAVASIFGESKDIEDFERRLNDPKTQISNLDLNNDGEVDYLRVMETSSGNTHTLSIEAVIGKDLYQNVATIDVVKDKSSKTQVQVVGNVDMYGPNYYINPVYPVVPVFFSFFWMATYRPWYSPWYWGYHPPYWSPWRPYPPYAYRNNVHVHVNINNTYNRNNVRINNNNININSNNNAYFRNNPDKTFNKRNPGMTNKTDLANNRRDMANKAGINNKADLERVATDRGVNTRDVANKDYKSTGRPVTKNNDKAATRPSQPATRPSTQPSTGARPTTTRPSSPSTRPSTPSTRPSTTPSNKGASSYKRPSTSSSKPPPRPAHTRAAPPSRSFRR